MATSKLSATSSHINIPEVENFSGDFFYNFYTINERVSAISGLNPTTAPRYVSLTWKAQTLFGASSDASNSESTTLILQKLISEDDSFSNLYISKNFSEVNDITKAAINLNSFYEAEQGWFDKSLKDKKDAIIKKFEGSSFSQLQDKLGTQYDLLADLPSATIGLDVFDSEGNLLDKGNFFKSMASSLSLNIKIHKQITKDVLTTSEIIQEEIDELVNISTDPNSTQNASITSFDSPTNPNDLKTIKFIGYLIKRYRYQEDGSLREEFVKIIKNISTAFYNDTGVVYGGKYVYFISTIFSIPLVGTVQQGENTTSDQFNVYMQSRSSLFNISCFEYKPPPPPADIRFFFDYIKRKLVMTWDYPTNSQSDIKQFQIFRRQSLDHPFELIYQYGFDTSEPGYIAKSAITSEFEDRLLEKNSAGEIVTPSEQQAFFSGRRYTTGEKVDANNIENMSADLRNLVVDLAVIGEPSVPIFKHVDEDFSVDAENFTTTTFIYAMSAVDAHGMISNYSTQYKVSFDLYKNKLTTELVCDEGSPRAYPNFNLVLDTFKDSINTTGMKLKDLEIYFDPENFQVINNIGKTFDVVSIQKPEDPPGAKPFYHFQMINLDNQLTQVLRINVGTVPVPPEDIITVIQTPPEE